MVSSALVLAVTSAVILVELADFPLDDLADDLDAVDDNADDLADAAFADLPLLLDLVFVTVAVTISTLLLAVVMIPLGD